MLDEIERYDTIKNSKEEGFEEEENSGIQKNKIETARMMLQKNMKLEDIIDITGLSNEEIQKIEEN